MKRKLYVVCLFLLSVLLCAGYAGAYDSSNLTIPSSATAIQYGTSGAGRPLMAYRFGDGKNVMVLGYEIHGYEDNFDKDGGALVWAAGQMMDQLHQNLTLLDEYDWTVYVLPSMNPDGLIDGYSNNGPGRLTTTYIDSSGNLSSAHGVDMNRSFPTGWKRNTSNRNYTGPAPLASMECAALAKFVQDVKGSGVNMCFDVHGWFSQIITSNGKDSTLFNTLHSAFPGNSYSSCRNGSGYFTAYTTALGYISCLFEYPGNVWSFSGFQRSGYCEKFNGAILSLVKSYGQYNPTVYTVATRTQGAGSGSVSGGGSVRSGHKVTLTAAASQGSVFAGWYDETGKQLSADASYSFTVTSDVTVYARFELPVTASVTVKGTGSVTGAGDYASGSTVKLEAAPSSGYYFLGWYDGNGKVLSTDATYSFTIQNNVSIRAQFGAEITALASRSGSVTGAGVLPQDAAATLTAVPQEGHTLQGWYDLSGNLLSTEPSYSFTVGQAQTVVAIFSDDRFYDLKSEDWFLDNVNEAISRKLVQGMTTISFGPDFTMTRAQVVMILSRMEQADTAAATPCHFRDVDQSQWYAGAVNWAYENHIVLGMSDTSFAPDAPITRQQFMTMLVRYLTDVKGLKLDAKDLSFQDQSSIADWALDAVKKAVSIKLVEGYPDGTFQPDNQLPRKEGVTVLVRLAKYLEAQELVKEPETEDKTEDKPENTAEDSSKTETEGKAEDASKTETEDRSKTEDTATPTADPQAVPEAASVTEPTPETAPDASESSPGPQSAESPAPAETSAPDAESAAES